jgi:hypothetical protein
MTRLFKWGKLIFAPKVAGDNARIYSAAYVNPTTGYVRRYHRAPPEDCIGGLSATVGLFGNSYLKAMWLSEEHHQRRPAGGTCASFPMNEHFAFNGRGASTTPLAA